MKIKVRQPLAELKIAGVERVKRAVERFSDQICDELNIKKVSWHDEQEGENPLLKLEIRVNLKKLAPKVGSKIKEVETYIRETFEKTGKGPKFLADLKSQNFEGATWEFPLPSGHLSIPHDFEDFIPSLTSPVKEWTGLSDGNTELLLDARITSALALEGMAREVIRHAQNSRKDADLQMEDRIVLYLGTESANLAEAIETHRDYIAAETLVAEWSKELLGSAAYRAEVKVDGQVLVIELRKA